MDARKTEVTTAIADGSLIKTTEFFVTDIRKLRL